MLKRTFSKTMITLLLLSVIMLAFTMQQAKAQVHDVAVTNITSDRSWIYYDHGFGADINVTVLDNGDFNETVTVTLYYNITANDVIGTQALNVLTGQNGTAAFTWNATGSVAYPRNYTITAVATIPAGINSTLTGGIIEVRIPGDILDEGIVDIYDAIAIGNYFGLRVGEPGFNPDADLNHDGIVDIFDVIVLASFFGQIGSP